MRNKKKGFPEKNMDGEPRAKARFSPQRADGTTNTDPQERMKKSSDR
ncbi:small, acid-soluble spore protein K [Aquibacillus halophilus]|uniref:Small, acid-soluble spore protein K n=1 Tax=Aquibacillus halophilus TaxID=930132 RepID=A0A6A8DLM0_9BACI|nr:small acid-soluble spore protein K [Aquibacillus halophilus]MRH44659.1 small, acid-soluble spore protein K [Aquibacillus halophilus]